MTCLRFLGSFSLKRMLQQYFYRLLILGGQPSALVIPCHRMALEPS